MVRPDIVWAILAGFGPGWANVGLPDLGEVGRVSARSLPNLAQRRPNLSDELRPCFSLGGSRGQTSVQISFTDVAWQTPTQVRIAWVVVLEWPDCLYNVGSLQRRRYRLGEAFGDAPRDSAPWPGGTSPWRAHLLPVARWPLVSHARETAPREPTRDKYMGRRRPKVVVSWPLLVDMLRCVLVALGIALEGLLTAFALALIWPPCTCVGIPLFCLVLRPCLGRLRFRPNVARRRPILCDVAFK